MRTLTQRRRSAARLLSLAAVAGLGTYHNTDPANPGNGGGGGTTPPAPKPAETDPDKVTLTKAELDAKIEAAVKAQQDKADAAARKRQEEADRKAAEEQGKFKELADAERTRNAELAAEVRRLKVENAMGRHLADKHPDYVTCSKYILPHVPTDTPDDKLDRAVEQAAADYVRDNPRQPKGSAGAPPAPRGGNVRPNQHRTNGNTQPARQPSVAASRL
jgi:hypothetical protein